MISVGLSSQPASNSVIFSDTINVIMSNFAWWNYQFIPLLVTLTIFQAYSSVKQFQLKTLCAYQIELQLFRSVKYVT